MEAHVKVNFPSALDPEWPPWRKALPADPQDSFEEKRNLSCFNPLRFCPQHNLAYSDLDAVLATWIRYWETIKKGQLKKSKARSPAVII